MSHPLSRVKVLNQSNNNDISKPQLLQCDYCANKKGNKRIQTLAGSREEEMEKQQFLEFAKVNRFSFFCSFFLFEKCN